MRSKRNNWPQINRTASVLFLAVNGHAGFTRFFLVLVRSKMGTVEMSAEQNTSIGTYKAYNNALYIVGMIIITGILVRLLLAHNKRRDFNNFRINTQSTTTESGAVVVGEERSRSWTGKTRYKIILREKR